jgi:hypothetical protein
VTTAAAAARTGQRRGLLLVDTASIDAILLLESQSTDAVSVVVVEVNVDWRLLSRLLLLLPSQLLLSRRSPGRNDIALLSDLFHHAGPNPTVTNHLVAVVEITFVRDTLLVPKVDIVAAVVRIFNFNIIAYFWFNPSFCQPGNVESGIARTNLAGITLGIRQTIVRFQFVSCTDVNDLSVVVVAAFD